MQVSILYTRIVMQIMQWGSIFAYPSCLYSHIQTLCSPLNVHIVRKTLTYSMDIILGFTEKQSDPDKSRCLILIFFGINVAKIALN